jgi:hypothetical protein
MKKVVLIAFLFVSNLCLSQDYHDTIVFNYLDSIWKTPINQSLPILNLDSSRIDKCKRSGVEGKKNLKMKFGYIRDRNRIYLFRIETYDIEAVLKNKENILKTKQFPENTFLELLYIFNGKKLCIYSNMKYTWRSGIPLNNHYKSLSKSANYKYKRFNLPIIFANDKRYVIKRKRLI